MASGRQWIGPVVVHGCHGFGASATWEQRQGLLNTPDLLSPYRGTPPWRRALQVEAQTWQDDIAKRQQDDIAKRQGDIKRQWQSLAHRHFWMRNRQRALASALNNTDSD